MAKTVTKGVSGVVRDPDLAREVRIVESIRLGTGKTLHDSIPSGRRQDDAVRALTGRAYNDALSRIGRTAALNVRLAPTKRQRD